MEKMVEGFGGDLEAMRAVSVRRGDGIAVGMGSGRSGCVGAGEVDGGTELGGD
jgi:hypothetical protein